MREIVQLVKSTDRIFLQPKDSSIADDRLVKDLEKINPAYDDENDAISLPENALVLYMLGIICEQVLHFWLELANTHIFLSDNDRIFRKNRFWFQSCSGGSQAAAGCVMIVVIGSVFNMIMSEALLAD